MKLTWKSYEMIPRPVVSPTVIGTVISSPGEPVIFVSETLTGVEAVAVAVAVGEAVGVNVAVLVAVWVFVGVGLADGVFVAVLVAVAVHVAIHDVSPETSIAPLSQLPPNGNGRGKPRWSSVIGLPQPFVPFGIVLRTGLLNSGL